MDAILTAVETILREQLVALPFSLGEDSIGIMPGPEPPHNCGQVYLSIYGTDWSPREIDANRGLHEEFGVTVCINHKGRFSPYDRAGRQIYVTASKSMSKICYAVMKHIHQNTTLFTYANEDTTSDHYLVEYLRWLGTDPQPIAVPPAWFGLYDEKAETAGYIMQVRFGQALRSQDYSNMVAFSP